MSLRFYFGASGAGKSSRLYEEIIARAVQNPRQQFFIIVPDQFTMQTQKDLVMAHPNGGIMNIDVLSFARLAHRIFEETGGFDAPVLDDTGKSLVLRRVAGELAPGLPVIGGSLHKLGYIHGVKSAISEFMQYGVDAEKMEKLLDYAKSKGALYYKLRDLNVLYRGFLEYTRERYVTTEETLDILKRQLPLSQRIRGSIVAFDGFTGFTPVQNGVIQELLRLCGEVIVTVLIEEKENPFAQDLGRQLFSLSRKTVQTLCRLAQEAGCGRGQDVKLTQQPGPRFAHNEELAHLERNLFRYPMCAYEGSCQKIRLAEASNPRQEVRFAALSIRRLLRSGGYCYRDIAVVAGDLASYEGYVEEEFGKLGIPVFLDRTRGILLNPFIEYIRSGLKTVEKNFSYETVFHFAKSGFTGIERERLDLLENYVLAAGIRGRRAWSSLFTRKTREMTPDSQAACLAALNETREELMNQIAPLLVTCSTVREHVLALYLFLTQNSAQKKLKQYEESFLRRQNAVKAREYSQIYRLVMDLLDQIVTLLGAETMGRSEFADILDAGFGEIKVGTIPQSVDKVVVGDIERTRLTSIKALFFLGVNDGNIPQNGGSGGLLSDLDREYLSRSEIELAPTPRQKMYIQRLYLYMNMTKPSDMLTLSFSRSSSAGKARKPAYLIAMLQKLFPALVMEHFNDMTHMSLEEKLREAESPEDTLELFVSALREYAQGRMEPEEEPAFFVLYDTYLENKAYGALTEELTGQAFYRYTGTVLEQRTANILYGEILENSVSRLEKFAACAYAHFLQYGMKLRERELYGFENVDMGNVFHSVLEDFSNRLNEEGYTWFDFPQEAGDELVARALEQCAARYGETVLYDTARNAYAVTRMRRILQRTVQTLQYQLQKGAFTPRDFEVSFSVLEDLKEVNIALNEQEKMRLRGRIDRIDTAQEGDVLYVKVIDYKSGSQSFDLVSLYYGLQLQLVVYLNAAVALKQKQYPALKVEPAAVLYYHVSDPMLRGNGEELSPEEINAGLRRELCTSGAVVAEENTIRLLDREFTGRSDVIPVERKKDGAFSARSAAYSREEMRHISDYVNQKLRELGNRMKQGEADVNPYEKGKQSACAYCPYAGVCGYDTRIEGYRKRVLETDSGAAMELIRKGTEEST